MTDNHHGWAAGAVLVGCELPAGDRLAGQDSEKAGSHPFLAQVTDLISGAETDADRPGISRQVDRGGGVLECLPDPSRLVFLGVCRATILREPHQLPETLGLR